MQRTKKPEEKRNHTIRVWLLPSEKAIIERAAREKGLDISTYCRFVALEAAKNTACRG
jgi:uncharacterized protein (DUF1778 family)